MHINIAQYTHPGGHEENQDVLCAETAGQRLYACICDGLGGMGSGKKAAEFCAKLIQERAANLPKTATSQQLADILSQTHKEFVRFLQKKALPGQARTTAVLALMQNSRLYWANVGDSRLYLFRGIEMALCSTDDTAAYAEYRHGALAFEDIRMADTRSVLTACLGDGREPVPHSGEIALLPGDGILLCSDGFWQYVRETEMGVDLCKAASALDWLGYMLNRAAQRSMLDGDNLSAFACQIEEDEPIGNGL